MSPISRQWVLGSTSQYSQLIQWWFLKWRLESVGASSRESSTVDCGVKTLNKRASWLCSGFLSLSLGGLLYFCRSGQNMFEPIRSLGYILDHITSLQRDLTELKLRINLKICTTINISWFFIIQPMLCVHESNAGFGASEKADDVAYALTRLVILHLQPLTLAGFLFWCLVNKEWGKNLKGINPGDKSVANFWNNDGSWCQRH